MTGDRPPHRPLRVALPLWPYDEKTAWAEVFSRLGRSAAREADLVLEPEVSMQDTDSTAELVAAARSRAEEHGVAWIRSSYVGEDARIAAAFVNPAPDDDEDAQYVYTKHTQAPTLAFDQPDWLSSWKRAYLRPFRLRGHLVGLTLCHDQTLSLLMRWLALAGADVLLDPSFGAVGRTKWARWLRTRAIENGVPVLATMWGLLEGKRKGYVFAFDGHGRPLPLRFVPTDEQQEDTFVAEDASETTASLWGYYLAETSPRLERPAVPRDEEAEAVAQVEFVGTREGRNVARQVCVVSSDDGPRTFPLGDRTVVLVPIRGDDLFVPERVARALLSADGDAGPVESPYFVLVNTWNRVPARDGAEKLDVVARTRALEHAAPLVLADARRGPVRVYGSTLHRQSRVFQVDGGPVVLDLAANRLLSGGPRWFFSKREENDFSRLRPHYLELLAACEEAAR